MTRSRSARCACCRRPVCAFHHDVAVIGFDDLDEARYSLPTLSTVDPGRTEIAETAVRVLLDRIQGAQPDGAPRWSIWRISRSSNASPQPFPGAPNPQGALIASAA